MLTLLTAAAVSTSSTSTAIQAQASRALAAKFILTVTADESTGSDKLDVWVQHSPDGTYWQDLGAFAQQSGNAGSTTIVGTLNWVRVTNETEAQTTSDGSLAASNVVNGPIWNSLRVKYAVTNASASAAFTFTVKAHLIFR